MADDTLTEWMRAAAAHAGPDAVRICTGTDDERDELTGRMLADGSLIALDQARYPGCSLHRSDPSDVARTEQCTFICSASEADAGPSNNWMSPDRASAEVWPLFSGSMKGRMMFVVPYLLGPEGSPHGRVGVEITDSPYVVLNLMRMTRAGRTAFERIAEGMPFVRGVHSTGTLDPAKRF
ncbi:MAG TPA: phosphoenolpyruvate carboxykinase, partial [Patescibacteria group bacterium]|nr:phosphoenolpyruvate carboxykinase [Patescibacteria group bacterium]